MDPASLHNGHPRTNGASASRPGEDGIRGKASGEPGPGAERPPAELVRTSRFQRGNLDLRWLRGVLPIVLCIAAAVAFLVWRLGR